jgi:transportin-3
MRNLATYHAGPKPIRLQLCVCLANLAIQMTEWKDVLPLIVSTLGTEPATLPCVLDFLRVLPEEVTHGRKINLTVCSVESPSANFPAPCGIAN